MRIRFIRQCLALGEHRQPGDIIDSDDERVVNQLLASRRIELVDAEPPQIVPVPWHVMAQRTFRG